MPFSSNKPMERLEGLGVSSGIAIGRAVCVETRLVEIYRFPLGPEELDAEVERFEQAVEAAQQEIIRTRDKVEVQMGDELAAIFEAHSLFLQDATFVQGIVRRIREEHVNAEWAVHRTAEELGERFAAIEDDYLRERREDLRDVAHQLLRSLRGISHHELSEIEGDVVIVADLLTPADALRLGRGRVVGFAIESGGRTSHTTIIARSLKLPAITGLPGVLSQVTDEDPVILDGENGAMILHPTPEVLADFRRRQGDMVRRDHELMATRALSSRSADGTEITLMANIDLPEEIADARRYGAAGVGLYRSEFLYIEKSPELPSEEEHYQLYRQLVEATAPHPAIIRTYDLGGRKLASQLLDIHEENPVLGLRGIRLTLARPEVFRSQVRALYRAAVHGDLWTMIPMVSTLEEVERFKAYARSVVAELEAEGIAHRADMKLGIMIEVPSAALIADRLAREVDFFSIGTNDLIQYALAVDRNNEHVAELYQPLHPALLRMVRFVVDSARTTGIEVSVCGEMASDSQVAPLLIGLGLRRLSMSPRAVARVKTLLRGLDVAELEEMARHCLDLGSASEVATYLAGTLRQVRQPSD
jgi:phosphotransferase system enzyme I (PtsI)